MDLLIEIGSEELPARWVVAALESFEKELKTLLQSWDQWQVIATPHRLGALVKGAKAIKEKRRGPACSLAYRDGVLTAAGRGFLQSMGIREVDTWKEMYRGVEYLYAATFAPAIEQTISISLPEIIGKIYFPKKMSWGMGEGRYARPLRWICALADDLVIPCTYAGVSSSDVSWGHRQRSPNLVKITSANVYFDTMRSANVLADPEERQGILQRELRIVAKQQGGEVLPDGDLLTEVVHSCEYPEVMIGNFSKRAIPEELVLSTLVDHQRCFPLVSSGNLLSTFAIVIDNKANEQISARYEQVVAARLSDGEFLYKQDLKVGYEQWQERLTRVHAALVTLADWSKRVSKGWRELSPHLPKVVERDLESALLWSKVDLCSSVVDEFPKLQGIAGYHYAIACGESEEVAKAVREHWLPRGEGDVLPSTLLGKVVAVLDKLDSLLMHRIAGMWQEGAYGLRRQGIGIGRLFLDLGIGCSLTEFVDGYVRSLPEEMKGKGLVAEISFFIRQKLQGIFIERGFTKKELAALWRDVDCPLRLEKKLQVLRKWRERPELASACQLYKRIDGLLGDENEGKVIEELLVESAERGLFLALQGVVGATEEEFLTQIVELQGVIGEFFNSVRVMDSVDQLKENRLALLAAARRKVEEFADFRRL